MVGVIDVATKRVETPEQVAETIAGALNYVDAERAAALHQLRHGSAAAGRSRGQAARGRGGRGAGAKAALRLQIEPASTM